MTGFSYTALWRSGVFVFVILWLAGFALRFIFNPAGMGSIDPVTMPAYRQIIVPSFLRWLFFYKPVKGSASYPGFMMQLPAFLSLGVTAVLAALFPSCTMLIGFQSLSFLE